MFRLTCLFWLALIASSNTATAFVLPTRTTAAASATQLHGLMDAFKNDESLGKPQNAGLTGGPKYNEQVTVNGKPVNGAVVGQKLTVVAGRARVKIPVNCQKGDCGVRIVLFRCCMSKFVYSCSRP